MTKIDYTKIAYDNVSLNIVFFFKQYVSFQVPVPKDNDNLLSKIDQLEAEENGKLAEFLKDIAKEVEALKTEVKFSLICL